VNLKTHVDQRERISRSAGALDQRWDPIGPSGSPVEDVKGGSLGPANAQPVCSSSVSGLVRCHVGCVTVHEMASSSPCVSVHRGR